MINFQNLFKMPPQIDFIKNSLKNVCVDTVLLFVMLAIVGHLTLNFWERFTLQSEISYMKHSLHSLKDTINNIGKAYDGLHTELKDLVKVVDNKQHLVPEYKKHNEDGKDRCKTEPCLEHRKLNDIQVQTAITNTLKVGPRILVKDKETGHDGHAHKSTSPINKNAATNTKNPLKSVGIMSDLSKVELERHSLSDLIHLHSLNHLGCYKSYEQCKRMYQRGTAQT